MSSTASNTSFRKRWPMAASAAVVLGVGALVTYTAMGQSSPPNIRPLNISPTPLYAVSKTEKSVLALALSVEFPTVGAQYLSGTASSNEDKTYSPDKEYLGYYNAEMCYTYIDEPTETPAAGKAVSDYKRFKISGAATSRRCDDAFSGNYLNWVSGSAVDMLRLALAGGDRTVDEANLTILQRAIIPDGTMWTLRQGPTDFWNTANFPAKGLASNGGTYLGAIPKVMRTAAAGQDVWAGNSLNQLYFKAGSKSSIKADYRLGAAVYSGSSKGPTTHVAASGFSSTGRTVCASENGNCNTNGRVMQMWYGAPPSGGRAGGWVTAPVMGSFACNNATWGDPAQGIVKSCYLTEYTGSWKPTATTKGLNSDGFFYTRAEVCNRNASGTLVDQRDYNFCIAYPSGAYKPTGVIQKYNSQLKLAAFGYAIDNVRSSDGGAFGGVLRAPAKFVGPATYDAYGQEAGANPNAEWDETTGIFTINPDNDTQFGNSGVINYLNKFGRGDPNMLGNYKRYDPAGELYYETLRYLQGLQPSAIAVSNLTKEMYDGFPIYTDWTNYDPFANRSHTDDYSCVKTNIALIGDVHTHEAMSYNVDRMPAKDLANNIPDWAHWLKVVQAFEQGQSMDYVDASGVTRTTKNPNAATYSGFSSSSRERNNPMIGLAYWAHTHDIRGTNWTNAVAKQRPGLRVKSFFFDVNEFANSTDAQRSAGNNQYHTAAKYGGFNNTANKDNQPYNTYGNPFYDQEGNANNAIWKKGNLEQANSYFVQSDARGVLDAFESIFSEAAKQAGNSIAGAPLSGGSTASSELYTYRATFNEDWSGDVQSYAISTKEGVTTAATNYTWSAAEKMKERLSGGSTASRNIYVGVQRTADNPNPTRAATAFTATAIEPALQAMLDKPTASSAADGLWRDRLEYIRGSSAKEGSGAGDFRERKTALGFVNNSGIQYVGAPAESSLGQGYNLFVKEHAKRSPVLYVGMNDGMLHAFNANTGAEVFAYIPSWMGSKLSALSNQQYSPVSFVDATPVIGNAKTGTGTTKDDWKTVLVSGTGGGGKGVFALDVTDPTKFNADKVMWEFTHVNDADMGYVIGQPRIVKLEVEKGKYRWFAMVPAGGNNYVDNGDGIYSRGGNPTIFLLALDKGSREAWREGSNYYKVVLPFDNTLRDSASPSVIPSTGVLNLETYSVGSNGVTDYVYAGDLHGNVWALQFTLSSNASGVRSAADWNAGKLSRFRNSAGSTAYPMFTAKDSSGAVQPITAAPSIYRRGSSANFIGLGTGKYLELADITNTQINTFYSLYDDLTASFHVPSSAVSDRFPVYMDRARLQQLVLQPDDPGRIGLPSGASRVSYGYAAAKKAGWFYDLSEAGERFAFAGRPVSYTSEVDIASLTPDVSADLCSSVGGTSKLYSLDLVGGTGKVVVLKALTGSVPSLYHIETPDDTSADSTGRRLRKITRRIVLSDGTVQEVGDPIYLPYGRLSWRQVNNYQELRRN